MEHALRDLQALGVPHCCACWRVSGCWDDLRPSAVSFQQEIADGGNQGGRLIKRREAERRGRARVRPGLRGMVCRAEQAFPTTIAGCKTGIRRRRRPWPTETRPHGDPLNLPRAAAGGCHRRSSRSEELVEASGRRVVMTGAVTTLRPCSRLPRLPASAAAVLTLRPSRSLVLSRSHTTEIPPHKLCGEGGRGAKQPPTSAQCHSTGSRCSRPPPACPAGAQQPRLTPPWPPFLRCPQFALEWGAASGPDALNFPLGVAVNRDRTKVFVCDAANSR